MTKVTLTIELEYDGDIMHGDDKDGKEWFYNEILSEDNVGRVKVVGIEHDTDSEDCWCCPTIEEHEGGNVIIHNRPN